MEKICDSCEFSKQTDDGDWVCSLVIQITEDIPCCSDYSKIILEAVN